MLCCGAAVSRSTPPARSDAAAHPPHAADRALQHPRLLSCGGGRQQRAQARPSLQSKPQLAGGQANEITARHFLRVHGTSSQTARCRRLPSSTTPTAASVLLARWGLLRSPRRTCLGASAQQNRCRRRHAHARRNQRCAMSAFRGELRGLMGSHISVRHANAAVPCGTWGLPSTRPVPPRVVGAYRGLGLPDRDTKAANPQAVLAATSRAFDIC